jgi:hypothetical protein
MSAWRSVSPADTDGRPTLELDQPFEVRDQPRVKIVQQVAAIAHGRQMRQFAEVLVIDHRRQCDRRGRECPG